MKKVAVIQKSEADKSPEFKRLAEALVSSDLVCPVFCSCCEDIPTDADRALVFGGDGTVLAAAKYLARNDISASVLGVNLGNLGFLTAYERDVSSEELLNALLSDEQTRMPMLEAFAPTSIGYAINDVVIKAEGSRPINLQLSVDGNFVDSYYGDGLIVSTAAGSTAYSLSAGGPVLVPTLDAIVINPICAHSLHSRPLVIGGGSKIEISAEGRLGAHVYMDGEARLELPAGRSVNVEKSKKSVGFVRVKSDFFAKLLKKMNIWSKT